MHKPYQQLTQDERDLIAHLHAKGLARSEIARRIGRDKSTISRELRRNGSGIYDVYLAHKAQTRAVIRKSQSGQRPRLKDKRIRQYVIRKLKAGWSPEQISGRLKDVYPDLNISHEAIYQFVYDKETLKKINLKNYLPRANRIRRPRGHSRKHKKISIPRRVSIDDRPKYIDKRKQTGHWESDTMISRASKASIVITLERATRLEDPTKLGKPVRDGVHVIFKTGDRIVERPSGTEPVGKGYVEAAIPAHAEPLAEVIRGLTAWAKEEYLAGRLKADAAMFSIDGDGDLFVPGTSDHIAPGGIDLNRARMQMNVRKEGKGVQMQFDPAMIERIKREGFDGLEFKIDTIIPITNLPMLLGLREDEQQGHPQLAGV